MWEFLQSHWWTVLGVVSIATLALVLLYLRLKQQGQGWGPDVTQVVGIILLLPIILILGLAGILQGEVIATLFGAVVGYLFTQMGLGSRHAS